MAELKVPDLFTPDCELITELRECNKCRECYRYEICKVWYIHNKDNGDIYTRHDGMTYFSLNKDEQELNEMADLWVKDDAPEWVRQKVKEEIRRLRIPKIRR